ncbi:hypothetical protein [Chryseobacterium capnotolerans]|uniref:hypothetical protein n=1 Tax=Chryseobacterium capnotolerans TaxID=2759528 RepID=UPI001E392A57|nr:hypothetical protein [Chryseobacterium capnotolerans]
MKKLLFGALALSLMSACNNDSMTNQNETQINSEASSTAFTATERNCPSEEMRNEALKNDPALRQKVADLEANAENFAKKSSNGKSSCRWNG